jgi:hypothetical protein
MDISVSRLNERMALRVPSELPLGLVFIVGQIQEMQPYRPNPQEVSLQLVEGEHSLPCRLPLKVADEMQLAGHERVRAGGHLVFDPRQARYFLLARDIEVLPSQPDSLPPETRRFLVEIEQRDKQGRPVPGELPPWVRQLAPPEIQAELGLLDPEPAPAGAAASVDVQDDLPPLPPEIVDYLSAAMDSEQEVELTRDVIHDLLPDQPEKPTPVPASTAYQDDEERSAPLPDVDLAPAETAPSRPQPLNLTSQQLTVLLLVGVFGFLFLVLIVLLVLALSAGYTLPFPT